MSKQITREQAEKILHGRFYNKWVEFKYPGYQPVVGKVDQIAISHKGEITIQLNNKQYSCSPETLHECLTLLTKTDGNNS